LLDNAVFHIFLLPESSLPTMDIVSGSFRFAELSGSTI